VSGKRPPFRIRPEGTTETVTIDISHRNPLGAFGEKSRIPPEKFLSDDAKFDWQCIPLPIHDWIHSP